MSTLLELMTSAERAPVPYAPDFTEPWQDAEEPFRYGLGYPLLKPAELAQGKHTGTVLWVMFNPSTATDMEMDATVRKVAGFSRRWMFGRFLVGNLFARRGTDPRELVRLLKAGEDVVGARNNEALTRMAAQASRVICAWGGLAKLSVRLWHRSEPVLELLTRHGEVWCLDTNADGSPAHPLFMPYEMQPRIFAPRKS